MRDQTPWIYIFNTKEKIKGFFLITVCNYVHGEHRFDHNEPFNSAGKSKDIKIQNRSMAHVQRSVKKSDQNTKSLCGNSVKRRWCS